MKYTLTLGLTALFTCTAFAAFNAPLPEFKNEKELAQWRAENASKPLSNSATEEPAFFTGKPYLESSSSYAFKYRNYNPEIARWTSEDPSGFPDGANGSAYAPNPIMEIDFQGLWKVNMVTSGNGDNNRHFIWQDNMTIIRANAPDQIVLTSGQLNSSAAPNTPASSITISGVASAQRGFPADTNFDNQTIQQSYTVTVDNDGYLSIGGSGTAEKCPNSVGIGILGGITRTVNGRSLTLDYNICGGFGQGTSLNSFGFSIVGTGANFGWNNAMPTLKGFISITFTAIE